MRISICIPAYNRGEYLPELLDSILAQDTYECEIEVVISDNASTDNTGEVVDSYRSRFDRLVYSRADENMGADRNFLKVVELASGDFCWLMGSDDILEPGSIAEIEKNCRANPDIAGLSLNRNAYTFGLDERIYERPVAGGELPGNTKIEGPDRIFCLLGEYFGYLSGQVVYRELWSQVVSAENVEEYFNAYVHIYIIGRMVQIRPAWFYVAAPCVGWRSANDSFLAEGGNFKRMAIDVVGYEKIARGLFGTRSQTYHRINRTVAAVHVRYALLGAKLNDVEASFFRRAVPLLVGNYWRYPSFWARTAPLFLVPSRVVRLARWGYRNTLKRARVKRLAR
ncbi:glycosyltransferase family 2 protein [Hoeflea sp.]|uniref:glycosyltransferase family 2 protein n=1 Tax=Hoeflea sp. TaxID=1940281 RepID=UPI0019CA3C22|nr:glycosyltransferase family 2 protein [Hoeflea sp.]MBC7281924.1 glycosyltransferase family 2 protein [Hoeflea sp.]